MYLNAGSSMSDKDNSTNLTDNNSWPFFTHGSPHAYSAPCLQFHISHLNDVFVSLVLSVFFLNSLLLWKPFLMHVKQRCEQKGEWERAQVGILSKKQLTRTVAIDILHGILCQEVPVHNSTPVTTITCPHFHYDLSKHLIVSLQKSITPWAVGSCCLNLYVKVFCHISYVIIVKLSSVVAKQFLRWAMHTYSVMDKVSHYFGRLICG